MITNATKITITIKTTITTTSASTSSWLVVRGLDRRSGVTSDPRVHLGDVR
jgi:hypothetical protein